MAELDVWLTIAGLTAVTVLARGFFAIPERALPLPGWVREALRVAPLAALVAVVAPEVLMKDGALLSTWRDPRWPAALAGSLFYFWKRDILGCILSGMAVLLTLKLLLHW